MKLIETITFQSPLSRKLIDNFHPKVYRWLRNCVLPLVVCAYRHRNVIENPLLVMLDTGVSLLLALQFHEKWRLLLWKQPRLPALTRWSRPFTHARPTAIYARTLATAFNKITWLAVVAGRGTDGVIISRVSHVCAFQKAIRSSAIPWKLTLHSFDVMEQIVQQPCHDRFPFRVNS